MAKYVAVFNAGDSAELALAFYGAPLTHLTASGTRVLSDRGEIEAYIEAAIDSLKVREGTLTSFIELEVCRANDTITFVRASAERKHAKGGTSQLQYLYLLRELDGELRIVSMVALAAGSPIGCSSASARP